MHCWNYLPQQVSYQDWCSVDSPVPLSKTHQKLGCFVGYLLFVCLTCCKC